MCKCIGFTVIHAVLDTVTQIVIGNSVQLCLTKNTSSGMERLLQLSKHGRGFSFLSRLQTLTVSLQFGNQVLTCMAPSDMLNFKQALSLCNRGC